MKKIFTILFLFYFQTSFCQLTDKTFIDHNGRVILTSDGNKVLRTEVDPNNWEYNENPEWISVRNVSDNEVWILAYDASANNTFTITCTTSSGDWAMDIYGGPDGKELLRSYDTTSNISLSHTLRAGKGKYSYSNRFYTYKIKIRPVTTGSNLLSIKSPTDNSPYLLINCGAKRMTNIVFQGSENLLYENTFYCEHFTEYDFSYCISLTHATLAIHMNDMIAFGNNAWMSIGAFGNCSLLKHITMPKEMNNLKYFNGGYTVYGYGTFANCISLEQIILPNSLPNLLNTGGLDTYGSYPTGAFGGCSGLKSILGCQSMPNLKYFWQTYDNALLLQTVTNCTVYPRYSIEFYSAGLKNMTIFKQDSLRVSSFTLKGFWDGNRSNISSIQIDWANSQFTGNIDIRYNNLSSTEIDRIFTALPTLVITHTIYVGSNVGSASCTPGIATAKNWTVVTS